MSKQCEGNGIRPRMTKEQTESVKKKILIFVTRSRFPISPSKVCEELTGIDGKELSYPLVVALMLELTLEGFLEYETRGVNRFFQAVPEKIDRTLTVVNQKE